MGAPRRSQVRWHCSPHLPRRWWRARSNSSHSRAPLRAQSCSCGSVIMSSCVREAHRTLRSHYHVRCGAPDMARSSVTTMPFDATCTARMLPKREDHSAHTSRSHKRTAQNRPERMASSAVRTSATHAKATASPVRHGARQEVTLIGGLVKEFEAVFPHSGSLRTGYRADCLPTAGLRAHVPRPSTRRAMPCEWLHGEKTRRSTLHLEEIPYSLVAVELRLRWSQP